MALFPMTTGGGSTSYEIVEMINVFTNTGTYNDKSITADVGDYLVLNTNKSDAYMYTGNGYIAETTDISIPVGSGYIKYYKVITAMSSVSLRILMQSGQTGGSILHIRKS